MAPATTTERTTVPNVSHLLDLVLANLPEQGLRIVLRALISSYPDMAKDIDSLTSLYLQRQYAEMKQTMQADVGCLEDIRHIQKTVRCFIGCRLYVESLTLMTQMLDICTAVLEASFGDQEKTVLISLDSDIAQALSLISLQAPGAAELSAVENVFLSMASLEKYHSFDRSRASPILHHPKLDIRGLAEPPKITGIGSRKGVAGMETFQIGNRVVPRVFCGLWQLSNSGWGSAPLQQIMNSIESYVRKGFTAFDIADIYMDVEAIFGEFQRRLEKPEVVFAATKFCTFHGSASVADQVGRCMSERLQKLQSGSVDMLQVHWQDYSDVRYIKVLKALQEDTRVSYLGLCNFDTEHMEAVVREGIDIKTNQVQFSLIDSRPRVKMAAVCEKHDIKLLCYGTLCGGFLSGSWLGKPGPSVFSDEITPSQRKYYAMIESWGGWSLFQELLAKLSTVAKKHNVSVSNVAARWVLDFPYVGAVIIGARMGISERTDDNLAVYGWCLDEEDQAAIETVLSQSRRKDMFFEIGDCGSEHR